MRGTGEARQDRLQQNRFIPACAGNGSRLASELLTTSVHPRVCGERSSFPRSPRSKAGSSPRVRGTVVFPPGRLSEWRFIPACAGNGSLQLSLDFHASVHPRVCGERSITKLRAQKEVGSSPRVRGTVNVIFGHRPSHRFIPACAGNGPSAPSGLPACPVHPRVCGERTPKVMRETNRPGSSPRVRGTVVGLNASGDAVRFIPACAGNGFRVAHPTSRVPVHPRVCGERRLFLRFALYSLGSSPRVRGTVLDDRDTWGRGRFIPACAGNGL